MAERIPLRTETVDPTTPGNTPPPTALGAAAMTGLVGTPASVTVLWIIDTYCNVHGLQHPFSDPMVAAAVGGFGASLIGFVVHVAQGLWSIAYDRLTRPPEK